jgi:hypothetical protein
MLLAKAGSGRRAEHEEGSGSRALVISVASKLLRLIEAFALVAGWIAASPSHRKNVC